MDILQDGGGCVDRTKHAGHDFSGLDDEYRPLYKPHKQRSVLASKWGADNACIQVVEAVDGVFHGFAPGQ